MVWRCLNPEFDQENGKESPQMKNQMDTDKTNAGIGFHLCSSDLYLWRFFFAFSIASSSGLPRPQSFIVLVIGDRWSCSIWPSTTSHAICGAPGSYSGLADSLLRSSFTTTS